MATALLLPLGALAVLQARSSLLLQQNLRGDVEALYAAEAVLEWAVASIPIDATTAAATAGPDGISGNSDDGLFPFGTPPSIGGAGLDADLRIDSPAGHLLRLTSTGRGFRGAQSILEGILVRDPDPYMPGAAYAGAATLPAFGAGDFTIHGGDHTRDDPIGAPGGAGDALPALVFSSRGDAAAARALLSPDDAAHLLGRGDPPSIDACRSIDLDAVAARAAAATGLLSFGPGTIPDDYEAGASSLISIDSDAVLEGAWSGGGILVVRGLLYVRGSLDYDGVVIALGGFRLDSAGEARVRGQLWIGEGPLEAWGVGGIAACGECVRAADAAFPSVLPHRFAKQSWRRRDS